MTRLSAIAYLM